MLQSVVMATHRRIPTPVCCKCSRDLPSPHWLDCGHVTCSFCIKHAYNEYKLQTSKSDKLICPSCSKTTIVPGQDLSRLRKEPPGPGITKDITGSKPPRHDITQAAAGLKLTPKHSKPETRYVSVGTKLESAVLLWNKKDTGAIHDLAFRPDGPHVVYVAGKIRENPDKSFTILGNKLYQMNIKGEPVILPFPVCCNDPHGVSVDNETGTLAMSDYSKQDKCHTISVFRPHAGAWRCNTIWSDQPVNRLAVTSNQDIVCVNAKEMWVVGQGGHRLAHTDLPAGVGYGPYVAIHPSGDIIVSTPNNHKVSVYNKKCELLTTFPSQFLAKPKGICTDSAGRVLIADHKQKTVLLFTKEGDYIQQIVHNKDQFWSIQSISLYQDRYLTVGTVYHGLFVYQLTWV